MARTFYLAPTSWLVADAAELAARGPVHAVARHVTDQGVPFVAVFTDDDLARTFIEEGEIADKTPVPVTGYEALAAILEALRAAGAVEVAVDMNFAGRRGMFHPIAEFIAELRD